jgi:hypothetical protein
VAKRSDVLRTVVRTLEADAALVSQLQHVVNANSVARGSRIFGFDTRLEALPEMCVVLGFADGNPLEPGAINEWALTLDIYAPDTYTAADLLDHLERIGREWIRDVPSNPPAPLNLFRVGGHQALEAGDARMIATRVALTVRWV